MGAERGVRSPREGGESNPGSVRRGMVTGVRSGLIHTREGKSYKDTQLIPGARYCVSTEGLKRREPRDSTKNMAGGPPSPTFLGATGTGNFPSGSGLCVSAVPGLLKDTTK